MEEDARFVLSDLIEPFVGEKHIVFYAETIHQWDKSTGRYEEKSEAWLKAEVQRYIQSELGIGHVKKANVDNLAAMVKNRAYRDSHRPPPFLLDTGQAVEVFPVANGVLRIDKYIETGELVLEEHTPNIFALSGSPVHYDPTADCQVFLGQVRWMFRGDESLVRLLQQFCAWVFVARRLKLEAIFWIHGPGGNGKSTLLMILRFVIGELATSAVGLQAFDGGNSFALSSTINKLANFTCDAIVSRSIHVAGLNQFVSGDPIAVNQKYKSHVVVTPATPCFVASNPAPVLDDDSDAFYRRILPILCDQRLTREEMDPLLMDRLKSESAGILRWMLAAVPELVERKRFDIPDSVIRHRESLKLQVNSARQFVAECIEASDDTHWLGQASVMDVYGEWCKRNGFRKADLRRMKAEMHKAFDIEVARLRRGGHRMPLWVGVRWKEDDDASCSSIEGSFRHDDAVPPQPCSGGYPQSWDIEPQPSGMTSACHNPSEVITGDFGRPIIGLGRHSWADGFDDPSWSASNSTEGGRA